MKQRTTHYMLKEDEKGKEPNIYFFLLFTAVMAAVFAFLLYTDAGAAKLGRVLYRVSVSHGRDASGSRAETAPGESIFLQHHLLQGVCPVFPDSPVLVHPLLHRDFPATGRFFFL